jgi:hypothetical protein
MWMCVVLRKPSICFLATQSYPFELFTIGLSIRQCFVPRLLALARAHTLILCVSRMVVQLRSVVSVGPLSPCRITCESDLRRINGPFSQ